MSQKGYSRIKKDLGHCEQVSNMKTSFEQLSVADARDDQHALSNNSRCGFSFLSRGLRYRTKNIQRMEIMSKCVFLVFYACVPREGGCVSCPSKVPSAGVSCFLLWPRVPRELSGVGRVTIIRFPGQCHGVVVTFFSGECFLVDTRI